MSPVEARIARSFLCRSGDHLDPQIQLPDDRLEKGDPVTTRLQQTPLSARGEDRQRDPRKAGAGADVDARTGRKCLDQRERP
jgi:hypothetical protein